jgi:hypothetical protein
MNMFGKLKLLSATLAAFFAFIPTAHASSPRLKIEVTEAPTVLVAGQSYEFTVEVKNVGGSAFTFSTLPGFILPSVCWEEPRKKGRGPGGCTDVPMRSSKLIILTGFDRETGQIVCKRLRYAATDFVTLQPNEKRAFQVAVETPDDIQSKRAIATVIFELESEFDGRDLGFAAWTGKIEFNYKLPIVQNK